MVSFRKKGDFSDVTRYLERLKEVAKIGILNKYGREGVALLSAATPVDTGLTASSWSYKIEDRKHGGVSLSFYNSNIQNGLPIAILIQYGHGTGGGGYVEGVDYIDPALRPLFQKIADEVWREVREA